MQIMLRAEPMQDAHNRHPRRAAEAFFRKPRNVSILRRPSATSCGRIGISRSDHPKAGGLNDLEPLVCDQELSQLCTLDRATHRFSPGVGGGENPRVNGDESVLKTGQSLHRAALGSVGPGRCETSRRSLMVQDDAPVNPL